MAWAGSGNPKHKRPAEDHVMDQLMLRVGVKSSRDVENVEICMCFSRCSSFGISAPKEFQIVC